MMSLMKLRLLFSFLIVLTGVGALPQTPRPLALTHPNKALDLSAGLLLEWQKPTYRLSSVVGDDGQTYTRIEAVGYDYGDAPGRPRLPRQGHLVALPPSGDFLVELIEIEYDTVALDYPVEPTLGQGDQPPGRETVAHAGPDPAEFVMLGEAVWMRDQRLARLTFTPFRYHPAQQTLDVIQHLRLRVWWEAPPTSALAVPLDHPCDGALCNVVINPADLNAFRARNNKHILTVKDKIALGQRSSADYKVIVATKGVYALDHATLVEAGLPVENIEPATLRLLHDGDEIAAQWEGNDDSAFQDGERLLFYARPQLTPYAGYDVYWLSWGGENGQRMTPRSGDPAGLPSGAAWATAQAEENVEYDSLYQGRDGERWFWRKLKLPDLISDTFDITLQTPSAGAAELTVWLHGFTSAAPNPDHHVRFKLNGSAVVGEAAWEGKTAHTAVFDLADSLLQAGLNTVGIDLPGDTGSSTEGAWVDALAITYRLGAVSSDSARFRGQSSASAYTISGFSDDALRVYDVTAPTMPRPVTGWDLVGSSVSVGDAESTPAEYLILTEGQIQSPQHIDMVQSLDEPPNGADYIIITHPDFATALAPLAAHRANQGLRVVTANVQAIYDHFGDGRMAPEAIRAFLSHAYAGWPGPAPQYVLLVGDGTSDPRGYRPESRPTYLPPYLADVDSSLGQVASDNQYANLTGDLLPDLRLGRLPVNTLAEIEAIVTKIISYDSAPLPGDWNGRLLFGADNPSPQGNHHADADREFNVYATPAYGYEGTRVYLASGTASVPHLYTNAEEAQDALIAALDQGALLYTYFGHASWHQEAVLETDNYAPLFHKDHIARLNNQRRWPMVLHMTCLTGHYTHPTSDTLDESLLRADGVGAIAVWGASGYGVSIGHRTLNRAFYQALFDDRQTELGAATHAALAALYATGTYTNLIATYHLFGDPALNLNTTVVNWSSFVYLPTVTRGP